MCNVRFDLCQTVRLDKLIRTSRDCIHGYLRKAEPFTQTLSSVKPMLLLVQFDATVPGYREDVISQASANSDSVCFVLSAAEEPK